MAKGVAIFAVVLGHTSLPTVCRVIIYSFHMPLFFMLSGVFLFNSCLRNRRGDFLLKKAKGLLVAYVIFNLVLTAFYGSLAELSAYLGGKDSIYDW
ncbi:hypothetical protein B5F32_05385 [Parabacteroides distasonis]|uniref:Acyltransferase 3 domain-containing protein n=1 Tax=Parabacteroides distasonis TaxID=823 RepID=A0A1Y4ILQ0_PARDI|nr:hypothetical protein B5F32_05385 [Parabacteroides distasonis]